MLQMHRYFSKQAKFSDFAELWKQKMTFDLCNLSKLFFSSFHAFVTFFPIQYIGVSLNSN